MLVTAEAHGLQQRHRFVMSGPAFGAEQAAEQGRLFEFAADHDVLQRP